MINEQILMELKNSFSKEEFSQLEEIFIHFDKNNDGFLEKSELLEIIHSLGFTELGEDNIDDFLNFLFSFGYLNVKINQNSNISFIDFLNVMKNMKINDDSLQISIFYRGIKKVLDKSINNNPEIFVYSKIINDFLSNDNTCKKIFTYRSRFRRNFW